MIFRTIFILIAIVASTQPQSQDKPARPGIKDIQVSFSSLHPTATFHLGGHPDWMAITSNAVWVANDQLKAVQRIDPRTNKVAAKIDFKAEPCSGLAAAFGSLWTPLCGEPASLARIDLRTNRITATLPIGPADTEGGIAASGDSVWIVTDKSGILSRIDPATNMVRQKVSVPAGSSNPLFSDGVVWVTGNSSNNLTAVDASTGAVLATIPVGPMPRFLTSGGGSIWTLNQGDGTVSRVDIRTRRVTATVPLGIPGAGGEICYGAGSIWTTVFEFPLTRIDARTNTVLRQWKGPGGDSVRFGHKSLWLTDYKRGELWRIPVGRARSHPSASR